MRKMCSLVGALPSVEVPYPEGFEGDRTRDEIQPFINVNSSPTVLSEDEIALVQERLEKMPSQVRPTLRISPTVFLDPEDPLLKRERPYLLALSKRLARQGEIDPSLSFKNMDALNLAINLREAGYRGS